MKLKQYFLLVIIVGLIACDDSDTLTPINSGTKTDTTKSDTTKNTNEDTLRSSEGVLLNVATWNVEQFPKSSSTVIKMKELIESNNVHIYAFQELTDRSAFNQLGDVLEDYTSVFVDVEYNLDYGFLIHDTLGLDYTTTTILPNLLRPPAVLSFIYKGEQYRIIDVHLKCCNDGISRRKAAANDIHAYIMNNYQNEHVIMVGDYNDDIYDDNVFDVFLNDPDNFLFADAPIQNGSSNNWSYPSWPSHLDHILISNEFFNYDYYTSTWKADLEMTNYENYVSDHRPVVIRFSTSQ